MISTKQCILNLGIMSLFIILSSCASFNSPDVNTSQISDPLKKVSTLRQLVDKEPDNKLLSVQLKQAQNEAAIHYLASGSSQLDKNNIADAIVQFERGLIAQPTNEDLKIILRKALNQREANQHFQEAKRFQAAGKQYDAINSLNISTKLNPANQNALDLLSKLRTQEKNITENKDSLIKGPITLNFSRLDLRDALEFIGKSADINIVIDEDLRSIPVTIFAENLSWQQSLDLITKLTKTFYRQIGPRAIIIAPDSKDKRGQYEDQIIRMFTLKSIPAKEMVGIIKSLLSPKKIVINETNNTIIVRDVTATLSLIEKLIRANDTHPAEIILAVEIIEINRSKAERLGVDYGSYEFKLGHTAVSATGSISDNIKQAGTLTIPNIAYRFFKQEVDARTLASPKIRTVNRSTAKIHIGDRVPLRSSSIQEATGQVRTTFDYQDVGIRLNVEPTIHLDNSSTVKLNLEVSTLGENLGTADDPAYRIGTRNAETIMHLRYGETTILGGLIRDEERNTEVKIPGLGSIPLIGSLFKADTNDTGRTDVLLTITPRRVRPAELPDESVQAFYSGNHNRFMNQPLFAKTQVPVSVIKVGKQAQDIKTADIKPSSRATDNTTPKHPELLPKTKAPNTLQNHEQSTPPKELNTDPSTNLSQQNNTASPIPQLPAPPKGIQNGNITTLHFDQAAYNSSKEQTIEITVQADGIKNVQELSFELLFDPNVLKFKNAEFSSNSVDSGKTNTKEKNGLIRVIAPIKGADLSEKDNSLVTLTFKGVKTGVAYLVFKTPTINTTDGSQTYARVRASRVTVQ